MVKIRSNICGLGRFTEFADECVLVPLGPAAEEFKGVLTLNEESAFLIRQMQESRTKEELVSLLTGEYDVDADTAGRHVEEFLSSLRGMGLLEE